MPSKSWGVSCPDRVFDSHRNGFAGQVAWLALVLLLFSCGPFLLVCMVSGCSDTNAPRSTEDDLIQADGGQVVTLSELNRIFSITRTAYAAAADNDVDPRLIHDARLRLLQQMAEELAIRCRAKELGIVVDDGELNAAIDDIRSGFSQDGFDRMFHERGIPFDLWKERISMYLLMKKMVDQDLSAAVTLTAETVQAYSRDPAEIRTPEATDPKTTNDEIADGQNAESTIPVSVKAALRHEKMNAEWPRWMASLKIRYNVRINWELWERSRNAATTAVNADTPTGTSLSK